MQKFNSRLCIFFFSLVALVHNQVHACDKENIPIENPNVQEDKTPEKILVAFLNQSLDVEELRRYETQDGDPRKSSPWTILDVRLRAQKLVNELHGLFISDIPSTVFRAIKASSKPADPYLVFALLKALYDKLMPDDPILASQKAFTLMARMIMHAPFSQNIANTEKIQSLSFSYFGHCGGFSKDLITSKIEGRTEHRVYDFWQLYFIEESYPFVLPWLNPLYYFYLCEAEYLRKLLHPNSDPFSDENWPNLREKIVSNQLFFNETSDKLFCNLKMDEREIEQYKKNFEYYKSLGKYPLKDVNIYWRLLPKLAQKPSSMRRDFAQAMHQAGADLFTIFTPQGHAALSVADYYQLTEIMEQYSEEIARAKELYRQRMSKRGANFPLAVEQGAKRICGEQTINNTPDV